MPQVACPDRESLGQLLLGNLSTERAELLEEHLLHCDRCSQLAETIPAADEVTAAFASSETIPVDEQLSLAIDRAKRLPANADTSESIETILRSTQDDAPAASQAFDPREIDFLGPRERPDDIGCLGGYRVLQVLGVGGMGVVFRAEDPQLKRQVALKAMKPVIAASLSAKDRFLKEAAATAAIEHDHIVTIYQVGEDRGIPFIAMQYLRGESLQTRLDREHLLHQREVVRIGRQIASGLAAAHEHDLIHRDVKPDNIWLESQQGRVKILDFGLVRSTHEETGLTRSGVVLGTPRYMSPEQAQGETVDHRCDLFSLGSVLYHLASGRAPFQGPNVTATLMAVVQADPLPIEDVCPSLHPAMARLIMRLLSKDRSLRPQSAQDVVRLLSDVEQQLPPPSDETSQIRAARDAADTLPLITGERQSVSRHPQSFKVTLVAVAALFLAGLIAIVTKQGTVTINIPDQMTAGVQIKVLSDQDEVAVLDNNNRWTAKLSGGQYTLDLQGGQDQFHLKDNRLTVSRFGKSIVEIEYTPTKVISATAPAASANGREQPVDAAPLAMPTGPDLKKAITGQPGKVYTVVYSPDGRLLASGGDGFVKVWDVSTGALRYALPVSERGTYHAIAFSMDGQFLLTASEKPATDNAIRLWEADTGKSAGNLGRARGVFELSFSPDGKTLLACGWEHAVRVWDFPAQRQRLDISTPDWTRSAVYSSGDKIAYSSSKRVFLCNADGTTIATIDEPVGMLCFSPDGRRLAGTTWDKGLVTVWDGHTGDEIASWKGHRGYSEGVAFSRDGSALATAGSDGTIRLWAPETGSQLAEVPHGRHASWVTFSPDGNTLASSSDDGIVKLWDVSAVLAQLAELRADFKPHEWPTDAPPPAIAPFDAEQATAYQAAWARHLGVPVETTNSIGMKFRVIPPGEFLMGSSEVEIANLEREANAMETPDRWYIDRIPSEGPQHSVTLTKPFGLAIHEVTRGQFRQFVEVSGYKTDAERDGLGGYGLNEGKYVQSPAYLWNTKLGFESEQTDEHPVVNLSWNDAIAFCQWLSAQDGVNYRLPTEAEWEYACRSGYSTRFGFGDDASHLKDHAWYESHGGWSTKPVGQKKPNGFGLFDMHGNVWEWCQDWSGPYRVTSAVDPLGPSQGTNRSMRGGSFDNPSSSIRSANRNDSGSPTGRAYSVGFRIVRTFEQPNSEANLPPSCRP